MTDFDTHLPLDEGFFDQIVDGVLTPVQLRAAIERLDREPGGWKRCALAFLEAQAWSESFRALGETPAGSARDQAIPLALPFRPTNRARSAWTRYGVAAGIAAAAFTAGWLGQATRAPRQMQAPIIVQSPPVKATTANGVQPPDHFPAASATADSDMSDPVDYPPSASSASADALPVGRTVARLRIGPDNAPAEVPILAGPGVTEAWIRQQPPPVSEHGRVVFQRHGYQVEQHRRILTTILPDGRRLAVPVDEVQIQYTGNEPL